MKKISTKSIFISILLIVMSAIPTIAKVQCKDNKADIFAPTECIYTDENSTKRSTTRIFAYNGHITADTIWDKDVIINGDVFVDEGVTLTITAGVSVQFIRIDADGDNLGDLFFYVNGNLITNGTEDNPVFIKSYEDHPAKSDWGGIVMNKSLSSLYFTNILYAIDGLKLENNSNVNIQHGNISNSGGTGIIVNSSSIIDLSDSSISNNNSRGIYYKNSEPLIIDNSKILNNKSDGINSDSKSLIITNSTISNNSGIGVSSNVGSLIIINSEISGNSSDGIFNYKKFLQISNSRILKNKSNGILNMNASLKINDTEILNNSSTGIKNEYGSLEIKNTNILSNNSNGIYNKNSSLQIADSQICNNGSHAIHSSNNINFDNYIYRCNIDNNTNNGIIIDNSKFVLLGCRVDTNKCGMLIQNSAIVTINQCLITNNSDHGINTLDSTVNIINCSIQSNGKLGLQLHNSTSICEQSILSNNNWGGVEINGVNSNAIINHCEIMYNKHDGLYFDNESKGLVNNCTIIQNEGFGIKIHGNAITDMMFNNVYDNKGTENFINPLSDNKVLESACIMTKTFSSDEWRLIELGEAYHPEPFLACKVIKVIYIKDGDKTIIHQSNYFYKNYTKLIVKNKNFAIDEYSKGGHGHRDMPQKIIEGNVYQIITSREEFSLSLYNISNCPNPNAWVTQYTYKPLSPDGYQLSILNEQGNNLNCQNNFWNQYNNFDSAIYQRIKGTADYSYPAMEPYTTNALPLNLNQIQLTNHQTTENSTFILPIKLKNITNDSIEGIVASIQFDNTVINPISVTTTGGILENISHTFDYNTLINEKLILAISIQTEPFNTSGNIAFATFDVSGKAGSETDFIFAKAIINEKPATSFNGHLEVKENENPEDPEDPEDPADNEKPLTATISGTITYFASPETIPISNTSLTLSQTKTTISNNNGQYSLTNITTGNYTLTPSKNNDLEGLSSTDASKILKHVVEKISLSCHEQIAADVSLDGTISATDAAKLAKYVAHRAAGNDSRQLNDMNVEWRFIPQAIHDCDHWPPIAIASARDISLNTDKTNMDFIGFRVGDANGSWIERQPKDHTPATRTIKNNVQEVNLTQGSSVNIPIVLTQKTRINGVDIAVTFDETVMDAHSTTLQGSILKDYQCENVLEFDNVASLVAYNSDSISGSGQIASINFNIDGDTDATTELEFKQFDCNDQPASGGFFVNGSITRKVRIHVKNTETNDHAIIIAGGGMEITNNLWDTTEYLSNQFYKTLKQRGFTHDQIMYFSDHSHHYDLDGDGTDDILVDVNEPTVQTIRMYIESLYAPWASPKLDENTALIIYMMDHGGFGKFQVNTGEYLKATDMDKWLDELQQATGCPLTLIVEACHSGTFIELLAPTSDQKRILISSSNRGVSRTDQQGMLSFSKFLFDLLTQGNSMQKSFDQVVQTISGFRLFKHQHPQLLQNDLMLSADNSYIGGTFITADILPEIISTTESQTIDAGPLTIQAEVTAMEGIQAVWISIVSPITKLPETNKEFETPILDSQRLDLLFSNGLNTYENQYNFSYNGDYIITFYAKDTWDNVSVKEICLTVENGLIYGDINSDQSLNLIDAILALKKVSDIDEGFDLNDVIYVLKGVSGM
jgi:hypothetical protein